MLGVSDSLTAFTSVVGALVLALGGFVGLRTFQARRQVDRVSIGLTSLEASLKRADQDREAQDRNHSADLARIEIQHTASLKALELRITALITAHEEDNRKCDRKLRRLGHIVKELGGEVPDELNGLAA